MADSPLESIYRRYLEALNERRLDDLVDYVHDTVVYNARALTRRGYSDLIAADIQAIPDLRYVVDLLVVRADLVACRLKFDCTPRHPFSGLRPTGRAVSFAEHVFYRFHDARIAEVWSLVDKPAIEAPLSS